ncbi:Ger(x)C family spore germination protein [Neobacillus drentensis]|uniref:Ger(x)C family spore germination protein n=1 Tax=Neobacillus drentensis TaxID=220684 RepID=UPI001F356978|nr:Ger(x)C family spore germination protein [Neobacillus drentensis]ULT59533.1 Ger(x)C family spore germination protein [Neobacillus drentensis]
MKSKKPIVLLLCLLLTGCWDQHLMKNAVLVQILSYDLEDNDKMLLGVSIPIIEESSGGPQARVKSETLSAKGHTPRDCRLKIDREVSGILDSSKNKLIMFGERMAAEGIYPPLDVVWRDPRNSLGATLGVVDGKAVDLLEIRPKHEPNVSEYIQDALTSAEENSIIPDQTIQTLASEMLDPGEDIVLPYLKMNNKKTAVVVGLALMNEMKYSGIKLSPEDSCLLLLLNNKKGKYARFTKQISNKEKPKLKNYVSFNVSNMKRKLYVHVTNGEVSVHFKLHLKVNVDEYPKGDVPKDIERLNKVLTKELTGDVKRVISKLQQSNCDAFGIGRKLIAFHPKTWEKLDKKEYFKNVTFSTNVKVEIIKQGIVL